MTTAARVSPFAASKNLQLMIAAVAGVAVAAKLDTNDPKVMKAYGKISAIEPAVAYLADKRGVSISSIEDMEQLLGNIRDNKLSPRERRGLAKIYNAHKRIGNFFAKGLEGITGENYGPSIALEMVTGEDNKSDAYWNKQPNVVKAFGGLQNIVAKYFAEKPRFVLN